MLIDPMILLWAFVVSVLLPPFFQYCFPPLAVWLQDEFHNWQEFKNRKAEPREPELPNARGRPSIGLYIRDKEAGH